MTRGTAVFVIFVSIVAFYGLDCSAAYAEQAYASGTGHKGVTSVTTTLSSNTEVIARTRFKDCGICGAVDRDGLCSAVPTRCSTKQTCVSDRRQKFNCQPKLTEYDANDRIVTPKFCPCSVVHSKNTGHCYFYVDGETSRCRRRPCQANRYACTTIGGSICYTRRILRKIEINSSVDGTCSTVEGDGYIVMLYANQPGLY
jgi:hypothetical protein